MKREQKILLNVIGCLAVTFVSLYFFCVNVSAKGINQNEQQVINAVSGTFKYDGKEYKAQASYIAEVRGYLSSADVDLDSVQASKLISYINGNVQAGVEAGYIIPVGEPDSSGETGLNEIESNEETLTANNDDTDSNTGTDNGDIESEAESGNENTGLSNEFSEVIDDTTETDSYEEDTELEYDTPENDINDSDTQSMEDDTSIDVLDADASTNKSEAKISNFNIKNIIWPGIILLSVLVIAGAAAYRIKKFFSKNKNKTYWENQNFIDIHAHILPGVDDGAKDMEETVQMLELAHQQGIHTIIATPHYHVKTRKTPELISEKVKEVQKRAKEIDENFKIYQGSEIFYEQGCLEAVKQKKASTMAESRYVLIEFSPQASYRSIYEGMREFINEGYSPIIAHIERYECLWKNKENIPSLIQLGCYTQINAGSIKGSIFSKEARQIKKCIKENKIHFVASDCHNTKNRRPQIKDSIIELTEITKKETITKMIYENPKKIIEKKYI